MAVDARGWFSRDFRTIRVPANLALDGFAGRENHQKPVCRFLTPLNMTAREARWGQASEVVVVRRHSIRRTAPRVAPSQGRRSRLENRRTHPAAERIRRRKEQVGPLTASVTGTHHEGPRSRLKDLGKREVRLRVMRIRSIGPFFPRPFSQPRLPACFFEQPNTSFL